MIRFLRTMNKPGLSALLAVLLLASAVTAGSLTPPGSPSSTMNTLAEIFDSIAGTFDSSSVVADQNGSLIEHLKYIEDNMGTGDGVGSDSLDFDEFVDAMALDADTSIASAGFVLTTDSRFAVATNSTNFGQFTVENESTTDDRMFVLGDGITGSFTMFRQRGSYPCCNIGLADIAVYGNTNAQGFDRAHPA